MCVVLWSGDCSLTPTQDVVGYFVGQGMVPMSLVSHISDIVALGTPCDCHTYPTKSCSSVPDYKNIVVEACNLIYSGNYVINSEHINSEPVKNLLAQQFLVPGWVCCSSYVWLYRHAHHSHLV